MRVRGVSLDLPDTWIDLIVDPNSLACKDTSELRALHDRIVRQLPKRQLTAFEAASEALEHVEEMQAALEDVREVSDHLDVLEEIRDAQAALHDLWMALGGIAATEDQHPGTKTGTPDVRKCQMPLHYRGVKPWGCLPWAVLLVELPGG